MSVKIRLKRMGMKKKPFYRVVVADIRSPRDGRFIEEIGYYDPMTKSAEIKVDNERAKYEEDRSHRRQVTLRQKGCTHGRTTYLCGTVARGASGSGQCFKNRRT